VRRRDLRKERSEKMIDDHDTIIFDERGTFIIDSTYEKIL
jgi:hypothetical protein